MQTPVLTRIGKETDWPRRVPVPVPIRRRMVPMPAEPEKEPVWVRPIRPPNKEPDKEVWGRFGFTVEEIPYYCPECGRDMVMDEGSLYCPTHGEIND